jgi:hypothetical protein
MSIIHLSIESREKVWDKIETHDEQYWPLCSREFLQCFQPKFEKMARPNFGFFQIFILLQTTNIVAFINVSILMF